MSIPPRIEKLAYTAIPATIGAISALCMVNAKIKIIATVDIFS